MCGNGFATGSDDEARSREGNSRIFEIVIRADARWDLCKILRAVAAALVKILMSGDSTGCVAQTVAARNTKTVDRSDLMRHRTVEGRYTCISL